MLYKAVILALMVPVSLIWVSVFMISEQESLSLEPFHHVYIVAVSDSKSEQGLQKMCNFSFLCAMIQGCSLRLKHGSK